MSVVNLFSLLGFTLMLATGQALFKAVGLVLRTGGMAEALRTPALWAALVLYGAATGLWIWILSRVPLTRAYPFVSLGTVLVPLLGWYWFREPVGPMFWLGVALIVAGLMLTQVGA